MFEPLELFGSAEFVPLKSYFIQIKYLLHSLDFGIFLFP
jgi:hypothetical protein